ncbi:hypothetical protein [Sphingomonas citri]|nr:hypothetical protein [Sphingomonas citri]
MSFDRLPDLARRSLLTAGAGAAAFGMVASVEAAPMPAAGTKDAIV